MFCLGNKAIFVPCDIFNKCCWVWRVKLDSKVEMIRLCWERKDFLWSTALYMYRYIIGVNMFWTKLNFELVHQLHVHVCEDAECPRLTLGNSRKPPAIPYYIAFLRPADLKGEVHFKMAHFFLLTNKIIQR